MGRGQGAAPESPQSLAPLSNRNNPENPPNKKSLSLSVKSSNYNSQQCCQFGAKRHVVFYRIERKKRNSRLRFGNAGFGNAKGSIAAGDGILDSPGFPRPSRGFASCDAIAGDESRASPGRGPEECVLQGICAVTQLTVRCTQGVVCKIGIFLEGCYKPPSKTLTTSSRAQGNNLRAWH